MRAVSDPRCSWLRSVHVFLLVAGLAGTGFFALADMAEDRHVSAADVVVRAEVQHERAPALERPMRDLSLMGSAVGLVPLSALGLLWLWPRDRRLALFTPLATSGAVIVEAVSKWLVARPRPNLMAYGFPSGHTLVSVACFGALIYVLCRATPRRLWRAAGALGATVAVVGIAYSRLYLDAHWLTDVVGGFLAGVAYLIVLVAAFEQWGRAPGSAHAPAA